MLDKLYFSFRTFSTEDDKNNLPYTYEGQTSIQPRSAQQLRFRYLSRVGKNVSSTLVLLPRFNIRMFLGIAH